MKKLNTLHDSQLTVLTVLNEPAVDIAELVYSALGHTNTYSSPSVQRLLVQGWCLLVGASAAALPAQTLCRYKKKTK